MAIDTSIYNLSHPPQMPSVMESRKNAASLSGMQLQNQRQAQDIKSADMTAHLQKAAAFGEALEGLSGLTEEERAQAYPQVRAQLLQGGIIKPEDAPDQYDPGLWRQNVMRYRQSKPGIEKQLQLAQIGKLKADATKEAKEAKAGKVLPSDKVLALSEGRQVPKLLAELRATVEANKDTFGPIAGRAASFNPWDEKAKTIDAQVRTVRQTIGKLKEGGVLRAEDEIKYAKMLPELSDTPEVALNKIALVEREMGAKLNDQIADLGRAGYDVSALTGASTAQRALPEVLTGGPKREGVAIASEPPDFSKMSDDELKKYVGGN